MTSFFSAIASAQNVDLINGIIRGVSVMTEGEAKGHTHEKLPLVIDHKTLEQTQHVALSHSGGIKVKSKHDGGVSEVIGSLTNFFMDGNQLRADLHLLKSAHDFHVILEMAEKIPAEFGLSVSMSGAHETLAEMALARCGEIYSIDLVDQPAANPNGLFSAKPQPQNTKPMPIEIVELAKMLSLPETATEAEVKTALAAKFAAPVKKENENEDTKKLSAILDPVLNRITSLESTAANAVSLAAKSEIDNLMAEASRDGKVVPLDREDLYVEKDGKLTIKTAPDSLRKMLSKLPKNQVTLTRNKEAAKPTDKDGKPLDLASRIDWCKAQREAGAIELNRLFPTAATN